MLRYNQEIAIRIHGCPLLHTRIRQERVDGQTLTERWIARSGNGLESGNKIDLAIARDFEGEPCELRGGDVDAFVDGEEARFCVGVVR
jgi:hypothetical protein